MSTIKVILSSETNILNAWKQKFQTKDSGYLFLIDGRNDWNDYGYHTLLLLTVIYQNKIIINQRQFSGFDKVQNKEWKFSLINPKDTELPRGLVTMCSLDLYRDLFDKIPKEVVESYLEIVKDICFNHEIAADLSKENSWPDFILVSFFRNLFDLNRWSKFGNSSDISTDKQIEEKKNECEEITSYINVIHAQLMDGFSKNIKLHIDSNLLNFDSNDDYNFDFTLENNLALSPIPTNCFAIIGENGVGKTTLLRRILQNFNFESKENSVFSQVALISFDTNTSPFKFTDSDYRRQYIHNIDNKNNGEPAYDKIANIIINALDAIALSSVKDKESAQSVIFKALDNFSFDKRMNEIILFMNIYFSERHDELMHDGNNSNSVNTEELKSSLNTILATMSSGEKMIFAMLFSFYSTILPKSLLLIDEPENTLHPPFIMALIDSINMLAMEQDSMVLIATHSPIIVQQLLRKNVLMMYRDSITNKSSIKIPSIETFATSIDTLDDYIFGLDIRKAGYYKYLKEIRTKHPELSLEEIKQRWKLGPHALSLILNNIGSDGNVR